ncbi:VOC family protein [Caulobacter sp. RL271]|jgi:predicted enzyme related to lactoylglutathione lyase|uniref:VOC family protein n=1 Tax=Caulobacter segnis TaxID=88688 RepID=A0ABY4ZXQ0_9CAUL|nr:VOC family protein [Caulobacter segnis]USQ96696.1 VOC family protein [Caulobacter segnis]
MKFAYTRLVTTEVAKLSAFYRQLLRAEPVGEGDYVEFRPGGAILALVSNRAAEAMHGGVWPGGANRSAILEFVVDDVDAERARLDPFVRQWLQEPKDMPWGNRSMLLCDPDGNPINVFSTGA